MFVVLVVGDPANEELENVGQHEGPLSVVYNRDTPPDESGRWVPRIRWSVQGRVALVFLPIRLNPIDILK